MAEGLFGALGEIADAVSRGGETAEERRQRTVRVGAEAGRQVRASRLPSTLFKGPENEGFRRAALLMADDTGALMGAQRALMGARAPVGDGQAAMAALSPYREQAVASTREFLGAMEARLAQHDFILHSGDGGAFSGNEVDTIMGLVGSIPVEGASLAEVLTARSDRAVATKQMNERYGNRYNPFSGEWLDGATPEEALEVGLQKIALGDTTPGQALVAYSEALTQDEALDEAGVQAAAQEAQEAVYRGIETSWGQCEVGLMPNTPGLQTTRMTTKRFTEEGEVTMVAEPPEGEGGAPNISARAMCGLTLGLSREADASGEGGPRELPDMEHHMGAFGRVGISQREVDRVASAAGAAHVIQGAREVMAEQGFRYLVLPDQPSEDTGEMGRYADITEESGIVALVARLVETGFDWSQLAFSREPTGRGTAVSLEAGGDRAVKSLEPFGKQVSEVLGDFGEGNTTLAWDHLVGMWRDENVRNRMRTMLERLRSQEQEAT